MELDKDDMRAFYRRTNSMGFRVTGAERPTDSVGSILDPREKLSKV